MSKLQNAIEVVGDWTWAALYQFSLWLDKKLGVRHLTAGEIHALCDLAERGPQEVVVYKDRPDTIEALGTLLGENAKLKAEVGDLVRVLDAHHGVPLVLQGVPGVDPEVHQELKDENDRLRAEAVAYANLIVSGDHTKGESRPNRRKLTKREVQTVRELKRAGATQKAIADSFDVNPATISRIVRGQYYGKVAA